MDVLVVEDEFLVAMAMEDCLRRAGHRVIGPARRSADALAHVARSRPDLAVVDIRLADGDSGTELAAELEGANGVPVLYASGQGGEAAASGRGVGVLDKPFSEHALARSVDAVARIRAGRDPGPLPEGLTLFPDAAPARRGRTSALADRD